MKAFPNVEALAAASEDQVNAHWAGLGFYRRARLLHQAAGVIVQQHHGQLPNTVQGLMALPGIGRYTASAIASMAYGVSVPVVDGNVCRVLSRLRGVAHHIKAPVLKDKYAWELAAAVVQAGDGSAAGDVNQALMELGATYCAPSGTGVEEGDPLREFYWSTRIGREAAMYFKNNRSEVDALLVEAMERASCVARQKSQNATPKHDDSFCQVCGSDGVAKSLESLIEAIEQVDGPLDDRSASTCGHCAFPLAPPKAAKREEVLAVAAISCQIEKEQAWLLVRRSQTGLLAGQWEFPSCCVWTSEKQQSKKSGAKRKDMSKHVPIVSANERRKALNELLGELGKDEQGIAIHALATVCRDSSGDVPIEHVFSHVRHTMWVEVGSHPVDELDVTEWVDATGRQVRWMRLADMRDVGITSGVKKVLKLVQKSPRARNGAKSEKKVLAVGLKRSRR